MFIETWRSFFLKVTALFWYFFFFCSVSFVTFIYLLLTIKTASSETKNQCASETKKQQQQGGFLFFQTSRKHFWNMVHVNTTWLPRRKLYLSQEKNLSRKTFDFQDHNDVNDSVKSQYNFHNSMCSVHQAVKKYIHSTISLFTHQCIPIALYNISCRMFLRIC